MDMPKFLEAVMGLKDVERTGWVERKVRNPETSSDHSLMVSLMVLVLGRDRKLDLDRALRMALVHDLPESITGDIISKDNWEEGGSMWDAEKIRLERKAMEKLASLSGDKEMLELWEEFEARETEEARFVKDADRLATILQAIEYKRTGNFRKPMEPFWDEKGISSIKDPEVRKFADAVLKKSGLSVGDTKLRKL
jgi:putative hydrolase of HD superfamily